MINLEKRLENLEAEINKLKKEVRMEKLKMYETETQKSGWKRAAVGKYMIKVVYPDIVSKEHRSNPIAGFPKNRRKNAKEIEPGHLMLMYATAPIKKIIGVGKVTGHMVEVDGQWPHIIPFEWSVNPKDGISLKDAGLDIRMRAGDTIFSLEENIAQKIINTLNEQPDLDERTMEYIANSFKKKH